MALMCRAPGIELTGSQGTGSGPAVRTAGRLNSGTATDTRMHSPADTAKECPDLTGIRKMQMIDGAAIGRTAGAG